jgi:hypothetical protein
LALPACENPIGENATRPGTIVKSHRGLRVKVDHTDAEGRLILADALTYAERFEPEAVVDIATLTGAMVIALGHVATGIFSNNDTLARALVTAGDDAYDRGWQLPLWDDYQEGLRSNFADFANIAGRPGGSITAACFLSRCAKKFTGPTSPSPAPRGRTQGKGRDGTAGAAAHDLAAHARIGGRAGGHAMSPPGRPKGEGRSALYAGSSVNRAGIATRPAR